MLFHESLACPEASGHWKGSKLSDWHHWRIKISFELSKLTVPAKCNPIPMPPNLEDVSKPIVPKELFVRTFLVCLHLCHVHDHIVSYPLLHTTGNRKLWSLLPVLHLISKSSLSLSSSPLITSHQSLTLTDSLLIPPETIHYFISPWPYLSPSHNQVLLLSSQQFADFPDSSLVHSFLTLQSEDFF